MLGGRGKNGEPLDPCTWEFGNGSSLSNCSEINPKFMYSGDPVTGEGWINIVGIDQRFLLSSGPFKLHAGEPIELIYAYIVGRGTDHLNSVTKARELSQFAQQVYDNNFEDLPTGIDDDKNLIVNEFKLYQNYPNPFNPSTTIKFTIPPNVGTSRDLSLRLKIYDILGREVKTLVNEQKPAGTYEVQFDASSLSSGVYFYQLSAGSFVETKKLMLLK
ncbi:MAG: T9SS type A sorting domain-containing protein [Ignavibacteriae bacterium]|nr:T9SS C-terminal target domain-containing protein [Ignavibacteriota bacterium]NOG97649.1 T9SS type A sorting domain-containing protein [Ignavibacteriota bacterium]